MATYKVKSGDTLMDVCYNTTGSLRAINDIMNANGFDTYTPQLEAGRIIEVPDVVYNSEAVSVAFRTHVRSKTPKFSFIGGCWQSVRLTVCQEW